MDLHSSGQKTRPHMTSHVVPYLPALCLQLSSSAIVVAGLKPRTSLCFCVAFGLTVRHKQKHVRSRCFQCAWRNISERAQSHSSLLLDPRGSSSPCLCPVSQSVAVRPMLYGWQLGMNWKHCSVISLTNTPASVHPHLRDGQCVQV